MIVTDATAVKYHQQDTDTQCGEAVAQMLLASLNGRTPEQSELNLPSSPAPSAEERLFSTAPVELARLLNEFQDDPKRYDFDRHVDGFAPAVQRIVQTLKDPKIAVPAMVYRKLHWVLICNALLERVDGTDRLKGFFLHNPWPVTARKRCNKVASFPPAPFPHAPFDACGNCNGHPNFGTANEYVTAAAWRRCYAFAPAHVEAQDGFVSVTPRQAAAPGPLDIPSPSTDRVAPTGGARIAAADAAVAAEGLREVGPLADALRDAKFAFVAGEVEVIDVQLPGTKYYSVVFTRPGVPTAGVALFDAVHGDFWGLRVYGASAPPSAGFLTPDAVRAALEGDRAKLEDRFGDEAAAATIENPAYRLVWTPSAQSRSPFMPVAKIEPARSTAEGGPIGPPSSEPLFVTALGDVVHDDLTV
jgi:hypothetical protein